MALPVESGTVLPPGRVKLKSGHAEVAFLSGAVVLLEGPAEFDVHSASQGFLHRGRLLARVPERAHGFTLGAPGAIVSDQQGEIGLLVDDQGRAEVHVFEGEAVAIVPDAPAGTPGQRLQGRTGLRAVDPQHALTPLPIDERAFASLRPIVRVVDASVRGGMFAPQRLGAAPWLQVQNASADDTWEAFLRFDLRGVTGPVRTARVRLMPVNAGRSIEHAAAQVADSSWAETAITWNNRPSSQGRLAAWTVQKGQPVEFDVTRQVQDALRGDRQLTLRIFAPDDGGEHGWVLYGAREGPLEARPRLLINPGDPRP
jgi:hypothetical protein